MKDYSPPRGSMLEQAKAGKRSTKKELKDRLTPTLHKTAHFGEQKTRALGMKISLGRTGVGEKWLSFHLCPSPSNSAFKCQESSVFYLNPQAFPSYSIHHHHLWMSSSKRAAQRGSSSQTQSTHLNKTHPMRKSPTLLN